MFGVTPNTVHAAPKSIASKQHALEEVIVSAQKRQQSQLHVPLSLAVINIDTINNSGVRDLSEAVEGVGNVTFDNQITLSGSGNVGSIYIRGIGQSDFLTTTDPGVGLYVDDVYISRSIGSLLDINDIERIEILRGPQGTLYGKNTIGGAIKVISKKPTTDKSLSVKVSTGTANRRQALVTANTPLSNTTQLRANFGRFYQDGYVDRVNSDEKLGQENSWAAKIAITSQMSDNLNLFLSADASRSDETAGAAQLVDTFELCPNGFTADFCDGNAPANAPPGQVFFFNRVPPVTIDAGGEPAVSTYDDTFISSRNDSYGTADAISKSDIWGLQATVHYQMPFAEFTSISALRSLDSDFSRDADHSPYQIYHTRSDVQHHQLSQELQLRGEALADTFTWLGGIYYLNEKAADDSLIEMASLSIQSGGYDINNLSQSIFFNGEYQWHPQWSLIIGARLTDESKHYTPTQWVSASNSAVVTQPPAGTMIVPETVNYAHYSASNYTFGIHYDPTENILFYGSWATGYKSGGFVQRNQLTQEELPRFKPERASTIEFGLHSRHWQQRLNTSTAIFYTRYQDIQVRVIEAAGFAPITANAAAAKIQGAEWDMTLALNHQLTLYSNIGIINAQYTEIGDNLADINLSSKFANTPEYTHSVGIHYDAKLTSGDLHGQITWVATSDIYNDAENTAALKQKASDQVNVSVTYAPFTSAWKVQTGIRNLLDETIIVSGNANRSLGSVVASYDRGRQWFASVEMHL